MPELRHADFRRIDLNLLVGFDALMQERHVGKAAAKVFIGQPAMSHVLARLREALDDELFVRSGNRMEPTALAMQLAPQVRAWLANANHFLFARQAFDLTKVQATLRISAIDGVEAVLLPKLMAALRDSAPGIRLWIRQLLRNEVLPALDTEEIDMALGIGLLPFKEWHCSESVVMSRFECVYAPEQVALPEVVTPQVLSQYEHVALSWRGETGSEVDRFFESRGLKRDIAVSAVSQLAVMQVLRRFPLVSLQSCMVTSIYDGVPGIAVRPIVAEDLKLDVRLIWHRRNDQDPAQAHVRRLVRELLAKEASRPEGARQPCPPS